MPLAFKSFSNLVQRFL